MYFGERFRVFRCTLFMTNLIGMFAFLSCFKLTIYSQYKHILCQVSRKMTNLSCFCQKSELNSKKVEVFRCFGGISVFRWYFGDSSDPIIGAHVKSCLYRVSQNKCISQCTKCWFGLFSVLLERYCLPCLQVNRRHKYFSCPGNLFLVLVTRRFC